MDDIDAKAKTMSPGLIKGILVTGIVFGCESLLWAGYYWIRYRRSSRESVTRHSMIWPGRHLARGGLLILLFVPAYYLFTLGLFNEFMLIALMLGYSMGGMLLEILFQGGPSKFFSKQPLTAETWQQRKLTKRQFVLVATLGVSFVSLETAIVFTIVSPEVLALHWWFVLVLAVSLLGFGYAVWQWNAWEKKFSAHTTLSNL